MMSYFFNDIVSALECFQGFFRGGGGGAFAPSWLWLPPLGYAEDSIFVNQL